MKQAVIYALDFDGVICDSALETGISGWKVACHLWGDFRASLPTQQVIDDFRKVRPMMGTGYEAIVINKLLHDGETVESIVNNYEAKKAAVIQDSGLEIDELKRLFGETRDAWIHEDIDGWVEKNPLFPGIAEKLQDLTDKGLWYIVTTKQERFVKRILTACNVQIPDERIFGLDRNMTKEAILIDLLNKHPDERLCFVEDMLASLLRVKNNHQLASVKLLLAPWGYNTAQDRLDAKDLAIDLIDFDDFLEE
ncbi:MAG: HAD family hydrolase [Methylococcales bacterium]|jgi:phosphoglycolate phosphatase-like HAD superfamily hydrolase|nr:HAD family hydrolase [Methylococcaceae bacterium]